MAKKCEIILEEVSMENLCNFYGLTQYRGRKYVCPFHADKNPSASISKDNKWFRCFGCGISVNTINFVCKYENCDKHTAITKLDTMFNLGLGRITWKEKQEIEKAKQLIDSYNTGGSLTFLYDADTKSAIFGGRGEVVQHYN